MATGIADYYTHTNKVRLKEMKTNWLCIAGLGMGAEYTAAVFLHCTEIYMVITCVYGALAMLFFQLSCL